MEISGSMVLTSVTKYSIVSEAGRNWAENLQTLAFASNPVNKTRNLSPDVSFMEQERCSESVEVVFTVPVSTFVLLFGR